YALRDGRNELWNNPEFVNPREVERYHAWGGLDDHLDLRGGLSGPVRLPMEPYACTVVESDDNVTVTLTYENPWVRLVRTHVVYPDTTRLTTREVVTNLDDAPRVLAPRPHPVFAVGGDVDNLDVPCALASVDYLLEAAPGGALVRRYALPIHRDVTTPVAGNWAGAVDPEKNEAVILTFDRRNVDEINLWFDRASYNVEPLAPARTLEKNASAEVSFDMFILSGDNLADQAHALPVDRDAARQIATALDVFENRLDVLEHVDREAFYLAAWGYWWVTLPPAMTAGGKPLALEVWAGTFDAEPAKLDAKLAVVNAGDGKEVDSPEAKVTVGVCESEGETGRWVYVPGEPHRIYEFPVDLAGLPDASYRLLLTVGPGTGDGGLSHDVVLAGDLAAKIAEAGEKEKTKFKPNTAGARYYLGWAGYAGAAFDRGTPARKSTCDAVERRLARAREYLDGKVTEPASGMFPRFYLADVDDSAQGYHVHLPEGYTKEKKWPVVVHLHGAGTGRDPFDPDRGDPRFDALVAHAKVILVRPHGRGNTGYRGVGADDVFRVLEIVKTDYSVDVDRVYLVGQSLGGAGTWRLATRYPDVFAAVAPLYGPVGLRIPTDELEKLPAWRRFRIDAESPLALMENLGHTPVYLYHGVEDVTVDVEQSRRAAKRLRDLEHSDFVYEEDPVGIHVMPPGLLERIGDFFLKHKLERYPKSVTLRTPYLRWAKDRWVTIDAFDRPMTFMQLDATVDNDVVTVQATNVTGFTLALSKELVDLKKPVVVNVNRDTTFWIDKPGDGKLSFVLEPSLTTAKPRWSSGKAPASKTGALVKTASVEGPVSDVFRQRFILVTGTAGDDAWDAAARDFAESFNTSVWRAVQHVDCLVKTDAQLTDDDRRNANLVLIGGPAVNAAAGALLPAG
ncbi:MAG TPA: PHB depolymerase family esterase, partial [Planctomycetota bacterium]|nr:PHB depolymerase family esterase [Planctomycetota bacterium]